MAEVPVTRPATVVKNTDGTYSVHIEHGNGSATDAHFPNMHFAEALANGYAAFINGEAKVVAAAKEVGPDLRAEGEKILAAARKEAALLKSKAEQEYDHLVRTASEEAIELRADAKDFLAKAEAEAGKLITDAKTEIEKLKAKTAASPVTPVPAAPAKTDDIEEI